MSVRKNIRISEKEDRILKIYCQQNECSETEAVRSLLRELEKSLLPNREIAYKHDERQHRR